MLSRVSDASRISGHKTKFISITCNISKVEEDEAGLNQTLYISYVAPNAG